MSIEIILILTLVAFFAGFFDAIAGGGGLVTVPALFLAGLDPVSAIATNKFQAASATLSATFAFARKGLIEWREGRYLMLFGLIGGASGALLIATMEKSWLEAIIPVLLIAVAGYFAFSPRLDHEARPQRISLVLFSFTVAPLLGLYDGIFGPGVGSFFMVGLTFLCGLGLMRAMSFTKLVNACCNLGALSIFVLKGSVIWLPAITMAVAAFLGAQLGARAAVRVGPRLIKPMLIVVCLALAVRLLSIESSPLRLALSRLLTPT